MQRLSKDDYYIGIARAVAARGTCIRRNFGAVIVNNDQIVGTGYTGSPRGSVNCCDKGTCKRNDVGAAPGERYELCESVHAEMNAVINTGRERCKGATIYIVGIDAETGEDVSREPCELCERVLLNAGLIRGVIPTPTPY
jgi:dCMP deaminase